MNSGPLKLRFYPKELLEALSDQILIAKTALAEAISDNPESPPTMQTPARAGTRILNLARAGYST